MNRDEIAGVLARISNAIDRHDYDAFAKEYAEDCVLESPIGGTRRGRAAVTQNERGILETFSDLRINQHTLLVEGDEAISVNTISGTDTGGFFGLPPSNKAFDLPVARVYAFRDGLVVSERRIYDFSRLLLLLAGEADSTTEGPGLYREIWERAQHERELKVAAEIQRGVTPTVQIRGHRFRRRGHFSAVPSDWWRLLRLL